MNISNVNLWIVIEHAMHKATSNKFMAQCKYMKLNVSNKSKSNDNVYGILSNIWHCDVYYIHTEREREKNSGLQRKLE